MKKKILISIILAFVMVFTFTGCSTLAALIQQGAGNSVVHIDIDNLETSNVAAVVASNTISSCVRVEVTFSNNQGARGAGFIITNDGYVVTNRHVCVMYRNGKDMPSSFTDLPLGISSIKIVFADNSYYEADLIKFSSDKTKDIAVLKMKGYGDKVFQPLTLDDTSQIYYGQDVFTFGNPEGLGLLFSHAFVASPAHKIKASEDTVYEDIILLDGNVNHGNSGGVLLNTLGNAIGLVYGRIESSDASVNNVYGIGCALAIKDVISFIDSEALLNGVVYKTYTPVVEEAPAEETSVEETQPESGGEVTNP